MATSSAQSVSPQHWSLRRWILRIGLLSGVINLLGLTGALFMLQVFDRVLTSRSVPTLIGLAIVTGGLFATQGVLEIIRSRILVRVGSHINEVYSRRAFTALLGLPLRQAVAGDSLQPLRDLDAIRSFAAGQAPIAILDLPWLPLYLAVVFLMHPLLGWLGVAGAVTLFLLAVATEVKSRAPARATQIQAAARQQLAGAARRNTEVLHAMGFVDRMAARFSEINDRYLDAQEAASDVTGGLGAVSRVLRVTLQSAVLALGAYLAIQGEVSAGAIIASSIAVSRALSPIDLAITHWRACVVARASAYRLGEVLRACPSPPERLSLPPPQCELVVEELAVRPPAGTKPVVHDVSFTLRAGQGLGIIGPSAAGKSTLVRALVGVWPTVSGSVRLDGAALDQWNVAQLGRHVGYLPQDVELFDGTVAENITRFIGNPDTQSIVAAAQAADVHNMILRLPEGYETRLGEDGGVLSGGQRQRIGLARALYGDPFLVVLDEPNSSLDSDGEAALVRAIRSVRERGGIVIVAAHRMSAIAAVDLVAVMRDGVLQEFGPREAVLPELSSHQTGSPAYPLGLSVVTQSVT